MRKNARVSLGLLAFTTLALSAMPSGKASAQMRRNSCTLEACVEAAQQEYACCSGKGDCIISFDKAPEPAKRTCAQELVADIAECPGAVLTCKLEQLGGGAPASPDQKPQ
jgi:hypothetical protein